MAGSSIGGIPVQYSIPVFHSTIPNPSNLETQGGGEGKGDEKEEEEGEGR